MLSALRRLSWTSAALFALVAAPSLHAQVSVAPTALFLTDQERFGGLYISNTSTADQEVTIGFRFGYPSSDSLGNVVMQYADSGAVPHQNSLAQRVRAFPQRFILPAGETQVVRLTAVPESDAQDGIYWTRVITTSAPQVEFDANQDPDGIRTQVQFRLQQVTVLFYRKGELSIGVDLGEVEAVQDSANIALSADIDHSGNGPFFGTADIRILDGNTVVAEQTQSVAFYVSERRRFVIPMPENLPEGSYTAELTITSERSDLPREHLIDMEPVVRRAPLTVRTSPGSDA